jgi:hypothetical protein
MAATGTLNAPPKRTAFGDVSNTARVRASEPVGKPVATAVVKPTGKETVKIRAKSVSAAASVRDIRVEDKENRQGGANENRSKVNLASKGNGNVNGSKAGVSTHAANPAPRVSVANQQHVSASFAQPSLRNGGPKKISAVYHDCPDPKGNTREAPSPVDDLAVLATKPVKNPRHYKSQPLLRVEQQSLRHQQTKFIAQPDNLVEVDDEGDIDDNVTEAAYEDAVEELSELAEGAVREALAEMEQAGYSGLYHDDGEQPAQPKADLTEGPVASEPEEYWDEEEDQEQELELYDEQEYTTAHSFRSHGDNTTSGPTILMAPPVTTAVQEELDMAKEHVLLHQTEEEVEEEAWDVSMVAEYGDEIFAYMRELEVISFFSFSFLFPAPSVGHFLSSVFGPPFPSILCSIPTSFC